MIIRKNIQKSKDLRQPITVYQDQIPVDRYDEKIAKILHPQLPVVRDDKAKPAYYPVEKIGYTLQPHQQDVLNKIKKQPAVLVYHNMGAGKTLTGLAAAKQENLPLNVIGPASLKFNFPKENKKMGVGAKINSVSTYNKPGTGGGMTVFDEAHSMGNTDTQRSHYPDLIKGKKTLFMTGTPIKNRPSELIPLLRGLGLNIPRDTKRFNEAFISEERDNPGIWARFIHGVKPGVKYKAKNLSYLADALEGKVSYYKPSAEGYPSVSHSKIEVDFTPLQEKAYNTVLKKNPSFYYKVKKGIAPSKAESNNMNAFLTASRQISNIPGEYNTESTLADAPKISRAFAEIVQRAKDPSYRGVTYSSFLKSGVTPLATLLEKAGIPYAVFTGETPPEERERIMNDYNSGKIKQLLISNAGSQGLDLKNTRLMQILEPGFNESNLKQAIGRTVRYHSHEGLPPEQQHVEVQHFIGRPRPHGFIFKKRDKGTDEYISQLARTKEDLNKQFLKVLKDVGTEKTAVATPGYTNDLTFVDHPYLNNDSRQIYRDVKEHAMRRYMKKKAGIVQQLIDKGIGKITGKAYLYHGTSSENAAKILKEGLIPHGGIGATPLEFSEANKGLVFTSPDKGVARNYARIPYFKKLLNSLSKRKMFEPSNIVDSGSRTRLHLSHLKEKIKGAIRGAGNEGELNANASLILGKLVPIKHGKVLKISIPKSELANAVDDPTMRSYFMSDRDKKIVKKKYIVFNKPISKENISNSSWY